MISRILIKVKPGSLIQIELDNVKLIFKSSVNEYIFHLKN